MAVHRQPEAREHEMGAHEQPTSWIKGGANPVFGFWADPVSGTGLVSGANPPTQTLAQKGLCPSTDPVSGLRPIFGAWGARDRLLGHWRSTDSCQVARPMSHKAGGCLAAGTQEPLADVEHREPTRRSNRTPLHAHAHTHTHTHAHTHAHTHVDLNHLAGGVEDPLADVAHEDAAVPAAPAAPAAQVQGTMQREKLRTVRWCARRRSDVRLHRKSSSGDGSAACHPWFRALAFGFWPYEVAYAFCFLRLITLSAFGFQALAFGFMRTPAGE